jgi:hypothetical protein
MKPCGSKSIAPPFLRLTLDGGEWSASRHGCFIPLERNRGTELEGRVLLKYCSEQNVGAHVLAELSRLPLTSLWIYVTQKWSLDPREPNVGVSTH